MQKLLAYGPPRPVTEIALLFTDSNIVGVKKNVDVYIKSPTTLQGVVLN
jgi:hypothetical protein